MPAATLVFSLGMQATTDAQALFVRMQQEVLEAGMVLACAGRLGTAQMLHVGLQFALNNSRVYGDVRITVTQSGKLDLDH